MNDFEFLIVVLLAAAVLVRIADLISVPYPIVLVLGGLGIGFIPGIPAIVLAPDVVFLVFLPPLLYSSALVTSPRELLAEVGPLASLALGLVLATMALVALVAHTVIPEISWQAAFVLGAILAPTDPISASATFGRLGAPARTRLVVEGEALLNDAAALVAYRIAVTAVVSGSFSLGQAGLNFVGSAAGGVAIGLAIGWLAGRVLDRLNDLALSIFLTLLISYAAYIAAEQISASGVLATVSAGLWLGWRTHAIFDADTRLSAVAFWRVLVFGLNATVFVLLGLQFPHILNELGVSGGALTLIGYAAAVAATVMVLRIAWQFMVPALARVVPATARADTGEDWRERLVVGWSGMRGAISLAAALALPTTLDSGAPFAERGLLVFLTVATILVTLVGGGITLPLVMRALGVDREQSWTPDEAIARLETAQAALDRLDELEAESAIDEDRLRRLRELYRARFRRCVAILGGETPGPDLREQTTTFSAMRREAIDAERAALLRLRNAGTLRADVMRRVQRDLDLDEARLPG